MRVAGIMAMVAAWLLMPSAIGLAQQPSVHYYHAGAMPPGAIGSRQLSRGGPLPGYYQPVEIKAPSGASISLAVAGQFEEPRKKLRKAGMLIGSVYRLRVTNIPLAEGQEVFPTIEIIDRLFTPVGQEHRFSIPVELSHEDLQLALAGKFVTRVIYLEDPQDALPIREDPNRQTWFEVGLGQDPLAVADSLGRPVAILRMGGRIPDAGATGDSQFFFGCPPFVDYPNPPVEDNKTPPAWEVKTATKIAVKPAAKNAMQRSEKDVFSASYSATVTAPTKSTNEVMPARKAESLASRLEKSKLAKTSFDETSENSASAQEHGIEER